MKIDDFIRDGGNALQCHSEHFRNVLRYDVKTSPEVLAVRVDASLYFANAKYLENFITQAIADRSEVKSVLLVCNAINLIDASALEIKGL